MLHKWRKTIEWAEILLEKPLCRWKSRKQVENVKSAAETIEIGENFQNGEKMLKKCWKNDEKQ